MNVRDIIISVAGHVMIFVGLLIPSFLPARELPPVMTVTVTAVTPQSVARLIQRVDRIEEPAKDVPQIPLEKEKAIPTPEKKTKKVQTVKRREASETLEKSASAAAPQGKAGKQGVDLPGVRVDQEVNSEYLVAIIQIIRENWHFPNLNNPNLKSIVFFEIGRNGKLVRIRVEDRSGNVIFDKSVYDAVVKSNPLPGLPDDFPGMKLGIHLAFSY